MKKVSEMIIEVSGNLFQAVESKEGMQTHLDLVSTAWNMSLYSQPKRKSKLKRFLKNQKKYAPNIEALKGLEWEMQRVMKQKDLLFPEVNNRIVVAEAVETGVDEYIIRAHFKDESL